MSVTEYDDEIRQIKFYVYSVNRFHPKNWAAPKELSHSSGKFVDERRLFEGGEILVQNLLQPQNNWNVPPRQISRSSR